LSGADAQGVRYEGGLLQTMGRIYRAEGLAVTDPSQPSHPLPPILTEMYQLLSLDVLITGAPMPSRCHAGLLERTGAPVSRPFPSCAGPTLTEIDLSHACSCHEILRRWQRLHRVCWISLGGAVFLGSYEQANATLGHRL
jgi:hypothetical protein